MFWCAISVQLILTITLKLLRGWYLKSFSFSRKSCMLSNKGEKTLCEKGKKADGKYTNIFIVMCQNSE